MCTHTRTHTHTHTHTQMHMLYIHLHLYYMSIPSLILAENILLPHAVSNIIVQVGVADGFPTQPLLGSTTTLNCSLAFHPQVIKSSFLTINYLWSSNGVPRGSGQNLVLPNLSIDDAMNYSCQVMVSSADSRFLIREITDESTAYNLMIKRK